MKHKLWLFQIPLVLIATSAFWITEMGVQGELTHQGLREKAFPTLRMVSGWFNNIKFRIRGSIPAKNKVVVVAIDNQSIATVGRWPWRRDYTAYLTQGILDLGARVVGYDIVFSEPDERVSAEIKAALHAHGVNSEQFETDNVLTDTLQKRKGQIVTGWALEGSCQPAFTSQTECPEINDPEAMSWIDSGFDRFGYDEIHSEAQGGLDWTKSPVVSSTSPLINDWARFQSVANHAGGFAAFPDSDGFIRRSPLAFLLRGRPHPSLPLAVARAGLGERLGITFDPSHRIKRIELLNSKLKLPVTPIGSLEVNFRGGAESFKTLSAANIIDYWIRTNHPDWLNEEQTRAPASVSSDSLMEDLLDAYVLIGSTATGAHDMRAFPLGTETPGVYGHANILDNILSGDPLRAPGDLASRLALAALMIFGALALAYWAERLGAVPALLMMIGTLAGLALFDTKVLFAKHQLNFNTGFLYLEMTAVFMLTVALKYFVEERNKKFIKGAFSKYVSPAIVDGIMKDPTKLSLGGTKKELSIMFSDIRGFTTFSEKMDAKQLTSFLNDYLGKMTDLVFAYGGTLDKYIGDAVMAFWGAPLDQPEHARQACMTAIAMQAKITAEHAHWLSAYNVDVQVGIGINSGAVSVGNMGSDRVFEYTVIGDQVNLASRVEGLTKYYGIKIIATEFTIELIRSGGLEVPLHRVLDRVKVKGKQNAVELVELFERPLPTAALEAFKAGRLLYASRDWDRAIEKFNLANQLIKSETQSEDAPSILFIERCQEFKNNPPAEDWDGSFEMLSK